MRTFEEILFAEIGLSLDDLPDRNPGYYDDFINENGEIDYEAINED